MKKICMLVLILMIAMTASSCATIMRGSRQDINVTPVVNGTSEIVTANCQLKTDDGTFYGSNLGPISVKRDKDLMCVTCENEEYIGATTVDGSVDGVGFMILNILIDYGTLSNIIDCSSGAVSSFPSNIRVPMRKKEIIKPEEISPWGSDQ